MMDILGSAPSVLAVRTMIERVRDTDAPVFLLGESGTGKELAARSESTRLNSSHT